MKIHIMTWNTGITEQLTDADQCEKIFAHIEKFLEQENSIAFLQQIAYMDHDSGWNHENRGWSSQHKIFKLFLEFFKEEEYDVVCNKAGDVCMMTVAIAKKGTLKPLTEEYYPSDTPMNRAIAVEFHGISFLGIHAQNNSDNKKYLTSLPGKADIILGDFNAGNYLKSENRLVFNQILQEHICICNMPTKIIDTGARAGERTCIDHIFVREDMITKCSHLMIHENVRLSDHFPVTVDYDITEMPYLVR